MIIQLQVINKPKLQSGLLFHNNFVVVEVLSKIYGILIVCQNRKLTNDLVSFLLL